MGPYDTEFLLHAHADRVAALRADAARAARPRQPRRRVAGWLITAGVRLAAEPPPTPRTRVDVREPMVPPRAPSFKEHASYPR